MLRALRNQSTTKRHIEEDFQVLELGDKLQRYLDNTEKLESLFGKSVTNEAGPPDKLSDTFISYTSFKKKKRDLRVKQLKEKCLQSNLVWYMSLGRNRIFVYQNTATATASVSQGVLCLYTARVLGNVYEHTLLYLFQ